MKRNGFGFLDFFLLVGLGILAVGIFVPFQRANDLADNEREAIAALRKILPHFEQVKDSAEVALTWEAVLSPPQGKGSLDLEGELDEEGEHLQRNGYVFSFFSLPEGRTVCAWPRQYSRTGHAVFLVSHEGELLYSRNDKACYSGFRWKPRLRLAFPSLQKDGRLYSKDGHEWKPYGVEVDSEPETPPLLPASEEEKDQ